MKNGNWSEDERRDRFHFFALQIRFKIYGKKLALCSPQIWIRLWIVKSAPRRSVRIILFVGNAIASGLIATATECVLIFYSKIIWLASFWRSFWVPRAMATRPVRYEPDLPGPTRNGIVCVPRADKTRQRIRDDQLIDGKKPRGLSDFLYEIHSPIPPVNYRKENESYPEMKIMYKRIRPSPGQMSNIHRSCNTKPREKHVRLPPSRHLHT